jgi:phenylacetate-coenzyme A ligase PaaK-like adenylate-forming protein
MGFKWNDKIFTLTQTGFEPLALEIFRFQYDHNPVYNAFLKALKIDAACIDAIERIPFLPISFFKTHEVKTGDFTPEVIFESSGTAGSPHSRHPVKDRALYSESFVKAFERQYGPVNSWCFIALLPSYLERKNSSLVYMAERMIELSEHPQSGFYLNEFEKLFAVLGELEKRKQNTLLLGVTFALLDFAEKYSLPLKHTIIMETGGMKGRREEMTRKEVHDVLKKSFSVSAIHSEYGMTELLSQAYSKGEGVFHCPSWMKIFVRDEEDPFCVKFSGSGAINIIDLANVYSCSFIATDDLGKLYSDESCEVLGRMDGSDLRGCGLMVI